MQLKRIDKQIVFKITFLPRTREASYHTWTPSEQIKLTLFVFSWQGGDE